jgi:hypothetical protein
MTSPDSKLINGNVANLMQLPSLESQGKVTLEDGLDHIPPDVEEAGHMFDRGNLAQIDHESIEGLQSPLFPFGEVDGFLQITAAISAQLEMAV